MGSAALPLGPAADPATPLDRLRQDRRLVLTLDAGGTSLVFSAVQGALEVAGPVTLAAEPLDLEGCLARLVEGFERLRDASPVPPSAISFGFPGPADYQAGVVGNTHNLPAFAGGVALGPMLEDRFGVPVCIQNDAGLFAYGEALGGFLPYVNALLAEARSRRRFHSLFGATLGTGFGGGIVCEGRLLRGDNGAAGEVWAVRHKLDGEHCAEDGVSARAVREEYARCAGLAASSAPAPDRVFEVATERRPGDPLAAREAFRRLGEVAGDALASVVSLLDCPVVIGGGLTGAASLFLPVVVAEMNGRIRVAGTEAKRIAQAAFDLEDPRERERFLAVSDAELPVPGGARRVAYTPVKAVPVGLSRLGASRATALGAYAVALDLLDKGPA